MRLVGHKIDSICYEQVQDFFLSGGTILYSHQQQRRVPIITHHHHHTLSEENPTLREHILLTRTSDIISITQRKRIVLQYVWRKWVI